MRGNPFACKAIQQPHQHEVRGDYERCRGSLQGLSVVKVAVAGRCHDHFMARLGSLHSSADALQGAQISCAPSRPWPYPALLSVLRDGEYQYDICAGHKTARSSGESLPMAMYISGGIATHSGEGMAASLKRQCPQFQAAHPPGHDNCARGEAALQDLVPADEDAALGLEEGVDAAHKPGLQVELVLQALLLDPPLARLALPPPHLGALQQHLLLKNPMDDVIT